jgi:MFS family permease
MRTRAGRAPLWEGRTDEVDTRRRRLALPEGVAALIAVRALRSFTQGCLGVAVPLYLLRIGVPTIAVGALFTASAVASAVLTLGVGVLADRWGRRPFVAIFAWLTALGGIALLLTRDFSVLAPVLVLAGFGRGGLGIGGAQGGPFAPALQALLAEKTGEGRRTPLFALASGVGAYAAAAGAGASGLAEWLARPAAPFFGYDILFTLVALAGLAMAASLRGVRDGRPRGRRGWLSPRSRRAVGRLSMAGAFNGLGWGFILGFTPIWFHLRFGVGTAAIGSMTAVTALLAGPAFGLAARAARRWGDVRVITAFRGTAPLLLALLPLVPAFAMAAAIYVAAMVTTVAVIPVRQSFAMGVVDEENRAVAVGLRATAVRLPTAVSPTVTGYFLSVDDFALPFWCTAACMGISALLYYLFFHAAERDGAEAGRSPVPDSP